MSITSQELFLYFRQQQDWALKTLQEWVCLESPTSDKEAVNRLVGSIEALAIQNGALTRRISQEDAGDHLLIEFANSDVAESVPMLFLGHSDTVWPIGQLARMPIKYENGRMYGPGIYDMKAGVLLAVLCLKALKDLSPKMRRPIKVLLTSDEERGSDISKNIVEQVARGSHYVLCLEPPLPGNKAKTFRKGVYHFKLEVFGRAAHAGVDHDKGINAIEELAHQILCLQSMTDYGLGTTVNVGSLYTCNVPNIVPDYAVAEIDVRASSLQSGEEISARIRALAPVNPNSQLKVSGAIGRPPLERTDAVVRLYQYAAAIAQELHFELGEGSTGGGSDGSLTAAMGIPTLDGMGVDGEGSHSMEEHILVDEIPQKAALLTRMVLTL
jgi:glutamate carboxypeptidase